MSLVEPQAITHISAFISISFQSQTPEARLQCLLYTCIVLESCLHANHWNTLPMTSTVSGLSMPKAMVGHPALATNL